jgi:hypothetical protein
VKSSCEHGNEPLGSIKCCETLELSDWRLLKKGSDSWSWLVRHELLDLIYLKILTTRDIADNVNIAIIK